MGSDDRVNKIASVIEYGYSYDSVPAYWLDDEAVLDLLDTRPDLCRGAFFERGLAHLCFKPDNHGDQHGYEVCLFSTLERGLVIEPGTIS